MFLKHNDTIHLYVCATVRVLVWVYLCLCICCICCIHATLNLLFLLKLHVKTKRKRLVHKVMNYNELRVDTYDREQQFSSPSSNIILWLNKKTGTVNMLITIETIWESEISYWMSKAPYAGTGCLMSTAPTQENLNCY